MHSLYAAWLALSSKKRRIAFWDAFFRLDSFLTRMLLGKCIGLIGLIACSCPVLSQNTSGTYCTWNWKDQTTSRSKGKMRIPSQACGFKIFGASSHFSCFEAILSSAHPLLPFKKERELTVSVFTDWTYQYAMSKCSQDPQISVKYFKPFYKVT